MYYWPTLSVVDVKGMLGIKGFEPSENFLRLIEVGSSRPISELNVDLALERELSRCASARIRIRVAQRWVFLMSRHDQHPLGW